MWQELSGEWLGTDLDAGRLAGVDAHAHAQPAEEDVVARGCGHHLLGCHGVGHQLCRPV